MIQVVTAVRRVFVHYLFPNCVIDTRSLMHLLTGGVRNAGYDIGTADGMNEKGLVVNELALVESDYGKPAKGDKVISLSTWPQYVLDNHATVAEAVADLRKEKFRVQTVVLATGRPANMHLVISDATGDSAVFEYIDGKLVIHHDKQYKVVTNSPTYDKQLAIMEYWKEAGGLEKSLPGTSRAADRFVRTTFLLDALPTETSQKYISGSPQQKFQFQATMSVLSLIRSVGTPPWTFLLKNSPGSPLPSGGP